MTSLLFRSLDALATDARFAAGVLAAARLAGLLVAVIPLRSGAISWRLGLGLTGSLAFFALVGLAAGDVDLAASPGARLLLQSHPLAGWALVGGELAIGAVLGATVLLVFAGVRAACQLISQQTGLAGSEVVDPLSASVGAALPGFLSALAIVVFFSLGLHDLLVRIVFSSFEWVPLGSVGPRAVAELMGRLTLEAGPFLFVAALELALPVLFAMLLVSLAFGILGRLLPEVELLVFAQPVRLLVGLFVLGVTLPASIGWVGSLLEGSIRGAGALLEGGNG